MALIHSLEDSGNILFKYRGQIPVVLFLAAIPAIYFTDYSGVSSDQRNLYTIIAIFISVAGFIFRAYAIGTTPRNTSGRNTSEQVADVLNSTGIYSIVRHPLYVGNYFMWIGIVAYVFNLWFVIAVTLAYWLYYERIMFAEERFLERKFGEDYISWSKKVPAFVPNFKLWTKSEVKFSLKTVLKREYSGFFATVLGFIFVDIIRDLSPFIEHGYWERYEFNNDYLIVLGVAGAITLVLRSLKHYTTILEDDNRS